MIPKKKRHGTGPGMGPKYGASMESYQDDLEAENLARNAPTAGVQSGLQQPKDALDRYLGYIAQDKADTLSENRKIGRVNNVLGAGYGSFGAKGAGSGFMGNLGRNDKQQTFADTAKHPEGTPLGGRFAEKPKPVSAQTQQSQPPTTEPTDPTKKHRPPPGGFVRRPDGTKTNRQRPVAPGMGDGGMFAQMQYVRENYPFEWSQLSEMFFNDQMSAFDLNGLIGSIFQSDLQRYNKKNREEKTTIA